MALTLEWRDRIISWRRELPKHFYQIIHPIALEAAFTKEQYQVAEAVERLLFEPMASGLAWGAKWEYGWFKGEFSLPEGVKGQMIALMIDVGAESAVYINGDFASSVDEHHKVVFVSDSAQVNESFTIVIEAYAGHGPREAHAGPTPPTRETIPEPPKAQCVVGQTHFGVWEEVAFQLSMDVETLWDLRENIDQDSLRVMELDQGLMDFALIVDFEAPRREMLESFQSARERLQPLLDKRNGDTTPEMIGFGHAHIDVAWLWPLAETERKCVRTFSNQLALMERYPEYRFLQSQPYLYQVVKDHYPELYAKILAAMDCGQWIAEGASWVEPDTNITGGESLIRQLIHGKRFYKQALGVDSELLWIPDVFGYSGALPQIMRGCGVRFFSTQKIFWAYHGGAAFPNNTFIWEGIDGSQVMAHFHNNYNSETRPSFVIERWKERVQKEGFSTRLFPFGWGDGGGGPTREHLEYTRRLKNLEGAPKFRVDDPMAFFKEQKEAGWPEARYVGELYFQAHRGTYTSQARTKALNRRSEFALREAELWGATAKSLSNFVFPYAEWEVAWKKTLLNQFHDILPGSSIHRVYQEAEAQLTEVIQVANGLANSACQGLVSEEDAVTVFNALSWERDDLVKLPANFQGLSSADGKVQPSQEYKGDHYAEVNVPSCGWKAFRASPPAMVENTLSVMPQILENNLIKVVINEYGEVVSIYDKQNAQELATGLCNSLKMYQDIPSAFDAWDIDSIYRQSPVDLPEKAEIAVIAEGPLFASLLVKRKLNNSSMTQTITLRRNSRRVDFYTVIDWQERHKLLKVNFPVDYHTREALHEIQFGHIGRPTHRSRESDQDQFEVANHKWTALVEGRRGFAVLNDSKYGIDVLDNSINLTLLKSALAPDMTADRGRQAFTYAFYFWDTPFVDCDLVQQGYQLNAPLRVVEGDADERSLIHLDQPNIILETVKPAEDCTVDDIVLRLYETMGTKTRTYLTINLPFKQIYKADMLEQVSDKVDMMDNQVALDFRPFEIKTLRLVQG
jgi:alpha-mannosidase